MYDADPDDKAEDKQAQQRKWIKNIQTAEKYFNTWFEKADKIIRLYRKQGASGSPTSSKRAFAMLWANTEVLKPVIYARTPEPAVARRFKDKDPAGKTASEIMERAASYQYDLMDIDGAIKAARDDMLLLGRGTVWLRYVSDGVLACDYIHWRDFLHMPARRWSEINWVAKRSWFARDELRKRFNVSRETMSKLSPDSVPKSSSMTEDERKALEGKYAIWEIWDKVSQRVYWITPSSDEPLEMSEPYLTLTDFWPCPTPIYATMTTDSMIPVPDYQYYQDQAEEIDDLTRRISSLTDSLKVVGFYPRGQEDSAAIESALAPGTENKMIGVESWAAFAEKGGGKAIIFLPIDMVVAVIKACVELRQQLIQDVYQITGISDIMRGATDPNETLGAQQLKAQTGSVRVRNRQQDVQRFVRDVTRIACEIMAEKFSAQVLMEMTNQNTEENKTPEKVQELMAAFQLLKDNQLRSFRVDIETDSTIQPDEQADKEARIEFITALGQFIQQTAPIGQAMPELLPMMGESLRFMVRGFRAGSALEDVIDKTIDDMQQKAQQTAQQPPPPSPEQQAQAAEQAKVQAQLQGKAQIDKADADARGAKASQEIEHNDAKHQQELRHMAEKAAADDERARLAHEQKLAANQGMSDQAVSLKRDQGMMALLAKLQGKDTKGLDPEGEQQMAQQTQSALVEQVSQVFAQALSQMGQMLAQQSQQMAEVMAQGNQQVITAITAPKQVTTPDGRIYTSETLQ